MRVQQRKTKHTPTYLLELMEQRLLLSTSIPGLPAGWVASHPFQPTNTITIDGVVKPDSSASPEGLTPGQMTGAYGVNDITFGGVAGNGAGETIAIVDAYDYPTAFTDLQAFDTQFGLPDPPSFTKLNQNGQAAPLPGVDNTSPKGDDWEVEESLDIEWAHSIAPGANIILFEANSAGNDLYTADAAAARTPGVSVISNSWGGDEFSGESSFDSIFLTPAGHQGDTFVFAAGDSGAFDTDTGTIAPNYPASSPNVVSVGGTTLNVTGATYQSESVWGDGDLSGFNGGGGGGISGIEAKPQYQKFLVPTSTTLRSYPDVAMDADPATGVPIYDTYDFGTAEPWAQFGGTSLACPMFAALVSIANQGRVLAGGTTLDGTTQTLPRIYTEPYADFHDITSGSNGFAATVGYDLGSGRGSPIANLLVPDLAYNYIGYHAFEDTNIDGVQEDGEAGIPGTTATLYTVGADGIVGTGDDVLVGSTTTDAYGLYEFSNVTPGTYYVHFVMPVGYSISPITGTGAAGTNSTADPITGDTGPITMGVNTEYNLANVGAYHQTISIDDASVVRPHSGVAPLVFTVTLAPINLNTTTVTYTTVDGTATVANDDYIPVTGTLVFPPGTTQENITVDAVGNLVIENNVTFTVNTTIPPGFFNLKNVGVGTIINSNFPAVAVSTPATQTRSATATLLFPFVVTLSAPAPFEVDVPYTTQDLTAIGGVDYVATSGTLVFPAESTTPQTIEVSVNPGTNRQLDKTFELILQASPTITLGTPSVSVGTILTNAPPGVNADPAEVTESLTGITYLPFTVDVAPSLTGTVTVDYATSNGTAIAGVDYKAVSGTLTFSPGRIQQTVYVPVFQQFIPQQDKTLTFTLSNPVGNILLIDPVVTGTIHYVSLVAIPFSAHQKAVYTDSLNQVVTVSMKGPGTGDVVFLGSSSSATNAYEITVDGTTNTTGVTMKVAGGKQTSLTDIIADTPLGSIDAKTTNITSLINIAGSLDSLDIGYVAGANITIGGGSSGQSVALTFNRFVNGFITSDIPIRSITAGAYLNTTGGEITITAPSVGPVKVKGNFGGTIISSNIASLTVGGTIEGGGIVASGKIGSVTAASIVNSTFYAGVNDDVTALPATEADFASTSSSIKSIKVNGGVFSDTQISGWSVGSVSSAATTAAGGTVNISGNSIGKVKAAGAASHKLVQVSNPTTDTAVGNVVVDVV